ncbi:hypothetical protein HCB44_13395 [Listeria sp. FSL L7-0229]|nr:hypothetical protein [Listeria cossartiae subsp. cossartiae]
MSESRKEVGKITIKSQQKISLDDFREKVASEIVRIHKSNEYGVDFAMAYIMKDLYLIYERYLETQDCSELEALVMAEDMFLNQLESIAKGFRQYINDF